MSGVVVELGEDLSRILAELDQPAERAAIEMIVLELYRRHAISDGKAARLLGMDRLAFLRYASSLGIPVIDMSSEEWADEQARIATL
jgi:hypothetical protein